MTDEKTEAELFVEAAQTALDEMAKEIARGDRDLDDWRPGNSNSAQEGAALAQASYVRAVAVALREALVLLVRLAEGERDS